MGKTGQTYRIKILKDGPYLVTGGVPLLEKRIFPEGESYVYMDGRPLPQAAQYALCRCGRSKNAPFCDGSHRDCGFHMEETASKAPYTERAELIKGAAVDLLDDGRCALARFCHRQNGTVWDLLAASDAAENRGEVIRGALECPSGRLTAVEKNGAAHEIAGSPAIIVLQDPENGVSAGLYVRGGIPIELSDGSIYETRARAALCRCGQSKNAPFCDASHIGARFVDSTERARRANLGKP